MSDDYWNKVFKRYFADDDEGNQLKITSSSEVGDGYMFNRFIEQLKKSLRFTLESLHGQYLWNTTWTFQHDNPLKIVRFQAKANNDIHVGLSTAPCITDPMYEIVIGGWGNAQSVIRRCAQGGAMASIGHSPCDPHQFLDYWVCIDSRTRTISCGGGKIVGEQQFMSCQDNDLLNVACVGFTTWDKSVEYRNVKTNSLSPTKYDFHLQFGNFMWFPIISKADVLVLTLKKKEDPSVQFTSPTSKSYVWFPKKNVKSEWINYYFVLRRNRAEGYFGDENTKPKLFETKQIPNDCTHFGFNGENLKFNRISMDDFQKLMDPSSN